MLLLVTGAGGFVGSHVVEALLKHGHRVRALVHYNSRGDRGHLATIDAEASPQLQVENGDVLDAPALRRLVSGCDAVLHLAALVGIPYSYVAPSSYYATNVGGTLNVLEACRTERVPRVVITSTSEVYGTASYTPMDEDHPLRAQSPYAASKIAADKFAESYHRSFGLPVVVLRPFNAYGPRQSARAVIPTILSQALSGAPVVELGNLETERDLTFVTDTARAFALAAETPGIEGETIHFGQGSAVSIGDLARLCLDIVGSAAQITTTGGRLRPSNSEVKLLLCDATKARRLLGWEPTVCLSEGLRRTADHIRPNLHGFSPSVYSL